MRARVKTALALALSLPAVAGCEKSPKDRLQGRWLGESVENVPPAQIQKATGWVKGTAIEFSGNKVTVTPGAISFGVFEGSVLSVDSIRANANGTTEFGSPVRDKESVGIRSFYHRDLFVEFIRQNLFVRRDWDCD